MAAKRVSMADVAAEAGVSGQTVSRVVNDSPRVDPATRARVEEAMERLGYRMHRAARALRTGRTHTIGLVVSTLATVGNSRMLQAVTDAAAARDYGVTVATLAAGASVDDAFERLHDQGVDGAIVLNEATASLHDTDVPAGLDLVVVDAPSSDGADLTIVQSDHAGGARKAVEHLLGLGHATVHHLAGPADSYASREREHGWRDALAGREVPEVLRGDWSAASGFAAASGLDPAATALFAANDQMALGALRALAEAGRDVPGLVSVVGFDDVADAGEYRPPLTTVRQDFDALGELAVTALIARIEGSSTHVHGRVPTSLVVRSSTAAPR
ncbi:LacI family DNA-binding transcriptional regulator [Microbacterium fluvii]|uniref:LacI family DNA-binding transcriptional regulator n=1 Tax=Microbacterium fluvii TaxID=415215 RepID=A0ABW2HE81_9MICO|nr:LacI family DNA-binding transcriptional regulator [Microbacterium fluvii]MCU4673013.1 LacI family transcriptional regulator [Microbacterium fluvii]